MWGTRQKDGLRAARGVIWETKAAASCRQPWWCHQGQSKNKHARTHWTRRRPGAVTRQTGAADLMYWCSARLFYTLKSSFQARCGSDCKTWGWIRKKQGVGGTLPDKSAKIAPTVPKKKLWFPYFVSGGEGEISFWRRSEWMKRRRATPDPDCQTERGNLSRLQNYPVDFNKKKKKIQTEIHFFLFFCWMGCTILSKVKFLYLTRGAYLHFQNPRLLFNWASKLQLPAYWRDS